MSADKNYGDPCDNDGCEMQRDGKCRKHEEFYDQSIPVEDRLEKLTIMLMGMIEMHNKLGSEIQKMIQMGMALSRDLPDNDNPEHESIDDILNKILINTNF